MSKEEILTFLNNYSTNYDSTLIAFSCFPFLTHFFEVLKTNTNQKKNHEKPPMVLTSCCCIPNGLQCWAATARPPDASSTIRRLILNVVLHSGHFSHRFLVALHKNQLTIARWTIQIEHQSHLSRITINAITEYIKISFQRSKNFWVF